MDNKPEEPTDALKPAEKAVQETPAAEQGDVQEAVAQQEPVNEPAAVPAVEPAVNSAVESAMESVVESAVDAQQSIQQELDGLEQPQVQENQDLLLDGLQDVQEPQNIDNLLEEPEVQVGDPLLASVTKVASVDSLISDEALKRANENLSGEAVTRVKSDKEMTVTFEEPQAIKTEENEEEEEEAAQPAEQEAEEADVDDEIDNELLEEDVDKTKKTVRIDEPEEDETVPEDQLTEVDEAEHLESEASPDEEQEEQVEEKEDTDEDIEDEEELAAGSSSSLDQNVEEMLKQYEDEEDVVIQSDVRTSISVTTAQPIGSLTEIDDDEPIEDVALPPDEQDKLLETSMDAWVEDTRDFKHEFEFTATEGEEVGDEGEGVPEEEEEEEERRPSVLGLDVESQLESDEDDDDVSKQMQKMMQRRKSKKYSVFEGGPRIPLLMQAHMVTGDFKTIDSDMIFGPEQDLDLSDYHSEEEEEKISREEKVGPVALDRKPYLDRHDALLNSIRTESMKNIILQRKLIDLMRKKKMDAGLREGELDENVEFLKRYKMQLIAYEAQEDYQNRELQLLNDELEHIKKLRDTAVENKEILFKKLQEREKEVGTGLIYSKTGKSLPDKTLENLLMRQQRHQDQICSMRLKFIKLKNKVAAIQVKLQKLELIDGHLSLMDYEALKLKFRGYVEKLEEREDELNKLRVLCQNSIQILAHYKEKSFATDADLNTLIGELEDIEAEVNKCRENLNNLKQERDNYRNMTYNLREESGLLTKPDLLFDMEDSIQELNELSEKLEKMEQDNAKKKIQVRNIRKNIEIQSEMKRDHTESVCARSKVSRINKTKKDSVTLPSEAFEDLNRLPKPNPCLKKLKIKY